MWERIDSSDGILAVGNFINERQRIKAMSLTKIPVREVDGYHVYLPPAMDFKDKLYAQWLLNNRHPQVRLHFKEEDFSRYNFEFSNGF